MKAVLKFVHKDNTFAIPLNHSQCIIIGRGSSFEYTIDDPKVSSTHCKITLSKEILKVEDSKSKNGTYLNGISIDAAEMFVGDELKIGDTLITLDEKKMDPVSISNLTFPGPLKQRAAYELQLDFTGARIQNQLYQKANPNSYLVKTTAQDKEIDVRKRAETKIRLSKEDIKFRNQKLTDRARIFDTFLLIIIFLCPIFYLLDASYGAGIPFLDMSAESVKEHLANMVGGSTLLFTGTFLIINMRLAEFSIGEKLVGIEKKYQNQD